MPDTEVVERETSESGGAMALAEEGTLSALARGEMAVWMDRAAKNPRQLTNFMREATAMATLNEEVAKSCTYAVPRDGKLINGASIRFAEIIQSAWRNNQAAGRVVDEGLEFVTAQGVFQDLERLTRVVIEVKRRIVTRDGKRYSSDMIGTTGNAGVSIAIRNAILRGIPKAFWGPIYLAARKVIAGDAKTMETRREVAIELLNKAGVTTERILARLDVKGMADIGLDEIVTLGAAYDQIRAGENQIDELFPPVDAAGDKGAKQSTPDKVRDGLRGSGKKKQAAVKPATEQQQQQPGQAQASKGTEPKAETAQPKMTEQECIAAMKAAKDAGGLNAAYNQFCRTAPDGVIPDDVRDMHAERTDFLRSAARNGAPK